MKSRLLSALLLCALLAPGSTLAQASAPASREPVKPVAAAVPQRPLLWKVSAADNSVYLLGSFHMLPASDYPLPAEVDRAFEDSALLLFEVDPATMKSPETAALVQKYVASDEGRTLTSVISPQAAERLATLLSASGGSIQSVEHLDPWAVSMGLSLGLMQGLGYRQDMGLDTRMAERASTAGKPARGLESVQDGFAALDRIPYPEQLRDLDEILDDPAKITRRLQQLHAWWRAGDAAELEREQQAELVEKSPETYRLLVVERNHRWLPQLERRLTDEGKDNTLVVVGAMHLLGPDGLVALLRAKGYRVERLCDRCETVAGDR